MTVCVTSALHFLQRQVFFLVIALSDADRRGGVVRHIIMYGE